MKKLILNITTIMLLCAINSAYTMGVDSEPSSKRQRKKRVLSGFLDDASIGNAIKRMRPLGKSTKDKPFKCPDCGATFLKQNGLIEHTRTHTGEKPFACTQCGESFSTKTILKNHLLTHSDIKEHVCVRCGESFKRKDTLQKHEKTHSRIKASREKSSPALTKALEIMPIEQAAPAPSIAEIESLPMPDPEFYISAPLELPIPEELS